MTAFAILIAFGATDGAGAYPFAERGEEELIEFRREHVHRRASIKQGKKKDDGETGINKERIDGRFEANRVRKQVTLS